MKNFERTIIDSDGNSEAQSFIQNLIEKNGQIIVPQLFWSELGNVLLNAVKTKKRHSRQFHNSYPAVNIFPGTSRLRTVTSAIFF